MKPFKFARYVDGKEMAEGVTIERETTLDSAMKKAVSLCPQRRNTVLVHVPPTADAVGSVGWKPIETAPTDNKEKLYLAKFDENGELIAIDFNGAWRYEEESWEMPHINYWYWESYNGIEDPTHWAYQSEPIPKVSTADVVGPIAWTDRELELIDGMIEVQLDHADRCATIRNSAMAKQQQAWDLERVAILRKVRGNT